MTNYTIEKLPDTHGRKNWKIIFVAEPTPEEVGAIVEANYPSPGYGPSVVSAPRLVDGFYWVFVSSNDSCD
jgi:hypothetical protein